jgi:hypothetical protein
VLALLTYDGLAAIEQLLAARTDLNRRSSA